MSEYITKEEVRAWRSSVEKITLEEYAARLGKKIEEAKETNDLVDIIYNGGNVVSEYNQNDANKGIQIYQRPEPIKLERIKKQVEPEKIEKIVTAPRPEISRKAETSNTNEKIEEAVIKEEKKIVEAKPIKKAEIIKPQVKKEVPKKELIEDDINDFGLTFAKKLTDREKRVFEHLVQNAGKVVFAKDIADLLDMKRDYIYKYIKNLRAKITEDVLQNSDGGGFILKV